MIENITMITTCLIVLYTKIITCSKITYTLSGTLKPALAVIIPIESIFVTSSYVNVAPTDTFPLNVASPVTANVEPSNVRLPLSCNLPADPAVTTLPDVKLGTITPAMSHYLDLNDHHIISPFISAPFAVTIPAAPASTLVPTVNSTEVSNTVGNNSRTGIHRKLWSTYTVLCFKSINSNLRHFSVISFPSIYLEHI